MVPFQNCSRSQFSSPEKDEKLEGNTGADGKTYRSYGSCENNQPGVMNTLVVANDGLSARYTRKNCVILPRPQPVDIAALKFAAGNSLLMVDNRIYDQQVTSGSQRVTLAYCSSATVTASVWSVVESGGLMSGSVSQNDGKTTGVVTMQSPSEGSYLSTAGQTNPIKLTLTGNSGNLSYAIAGGVASAVQIMCATQGQAPVPADGSATAPAGPPQLPTLLSAYSTRAPWKVAGVDFAVGYPQNQVLKNPLTDPTLANNPAITIDMANKQIKINGNDVVLDGYDFIANGGYSVNVTSGFNTTISNSKIAWIQTASGTDGLTVTNCVFDGAESTASALISHLGTGAVTLTYNYFKNFRAHVLEDWTGGTVIYKYNLLDSGGTSGSYNYLQLGRGNFSSVIVEFNTSYQPYLPAGADEGYVFFSHPAPGSISGELAYNTMIATAPNGQVSMSALMHIGGGTQDPTTVKATVHDNYMDASGSYAPFYTQINNDGRTSVTYSNNFDMTSGGLLPSNP